MTDIRLSNGHCTVVDPAALRKKFHKKVGKVFRLFQDSGIPVTNLFITNYANFFADTICRNFNGSNGGYVRSTHCGSKPNSSQEKISIGAASKRVSLGYIANGKISSPNGKVGHFYNDLTLPVPGTIVKKTPQQIMDFMSKSFPGREFAEVSDRHNHNIVPGSASCHASICTFMSTHSITAFITFRYALQTYHNMQDRYSYWSSTDLSHLDKIHKNTNYKNYSDMANFTGAQILIGMVVNDNGTQRVYTHASIFNVPVPHNWLARRIGRGHPKKYIESLVKNMEMRKTAFERNNNPNCPMANNGTCRK